MIHSASDCIYWPERGCNELREKSPSARMVKGRSMYSHSCYRVGQRLAEREEARLCGRPVDSGLWENSTDCYDA